MKFIVFYYTNLGIRTFAGFKSLPEAQKFASTKDSNHFIGIRELNEALEY
jgi:hypothetical protein